MHRFQMGWDILHDALLLFQDWLPGIKIVTDSQGQMLRILQYLAVPSGYLFYLGLQVWDVHDFLI